jgi:hypothetical protein
VRGKSRKARRRGKEEEEREREQSILTPTSLLMRRKESRVGCILGSAKKRKNLQRRTPTERTQQTIFRAESKGGGQGGRQRKLKKLGKLKKIAETCISCVVFALLKCWLGWEVQHHVYASLLQLTQPPVPSISFPPNKTQHNTHNQL